MSAAPQISSSRFVRRTRLAPGEYHKNFHKLDAEAVAAVTSAEADRVTPLMSKIYLRLVNAPADRWEQDGVLRFEAEVRGGKQVKAWELLCETVGVAGATASKALSWLHERGVIGYFAGKNGAGIRVFLNRAAGSIGVRPPAPGQKILRAVPASPGAPPASPGEAAFSDSFAGSEVSDTDLNPPAPQNGAGRGKAGVTRTGPTGRPEGERLHDAPRHAQVVGAAVRPPLDELVTRLRAELEPSLRAAARDTAEREGERTRRWLEDKGLPKAARVAQREAYNVLRKYGVISESARGARAHADVGRSDYTPPETHPLTQDEVAELAEACMAMLETKGQSIDLTLSEMSAEAGGFLLPEDAPRVRAMANSLLSAGAGREVRGEFN
jgi:hypothetical protein